MVNQFSLRTPQKWPPKEFVMYYSPPLQGVLHWSCNPLLPQLPRKPKIQLLAPAQRPSYMRRVMMAS